MTSVDVFTCAYVATLGVACGAVTVLLAGFLTASTVARVSRWLFR